MAVAQGFGAFVAAAEEVTWGTQIVTPTNFVKVAPGPDLKKTIEKVPLPHLGCVGSTSRNRRKHFTAKEDGGANFEIVAAYDDSTLLFLKHALGAVVTTGAGPFVHTLTLALDPPTGLSLWLARGNLGGAEILEGGLINQWEFKISSGGVASLVLPDVIGQQATGTASAPIATLPASDEILHSHATQLAYNGNSFDLISLSVKGDRKLARRQLLGSELTKRPTASDFYEVGGTLVVEYDTAEDWEAEWIADTIADAVISFAGSGNNALTIEMQNMYIMDVSNPVSAAGIFQRTITFRCEASATGEGIEFAFTNDNATAIANG